MNTIKITYQVFAEEYEYDFEAAIERKKAGESWRSINPGYCNKATYRRLVEDYCRDHGIDFDELLGAPADEIISNPEQVDRGKIFALRKAGWGIKNIAVDCHCTEECVREVLNAITR